MITNIHTRNLIAPADIVGSLLDSLASKQDLLWPHEKWPPIHFDRPLSVGAVGGHSIIGYTIESYEPGKSILFRFNSPKGFVGTHGFFVEKINQNITQIRHEIHMKLEGSAKLWWPLRIRWIHDAIIEDAFDKAEAFVTGQPVNRQWSLWIKYLRYLQKRKNKTNNKRNH
ncbi:MAG: hypothetical protein H6Q73_3905 [Firmicutes bacterium]|nr:hypothetical protein [Bacillota bacterium]